MKQTVNFSEFCDAFHAHDRFDQFGYKSLRALFDYLESYEEDCGEEVELDVIALCCDYCVYENLAEVQAEYTDITSLDDLRDNTTVIEVDGSEQIIIQSY